MGLGLTLTPWLLRNHAVSGRWALTSESGFALARAHNASTFEYYPYRASIDRSWVAFHEAMTADQKQQREELAGDEFALNAWYRSLGMQFVREHPVRSAGEGIVKVLVNFLGILSPLQGTLKNLTYSLSFWGLTLLALAGLRRLQATPLLAITALFLIAHSAVSFVFWAHTSHRAFLDPLWAIAAGVGAIQLWDWRTRSRGAVEAGDCENSGMIAAWPFSLIVLPASRPSGFRTRPPDSCPSVPIARRRSAFRWSPFPKPSRLAWFMTVPLRGTGVAVWRSGGSPFFADDIPEASVAEPINPTQMLARRNKRRMSRGWIGVILAFVLATVGITSTYFWSNRQNISVSVTARVVANATLSKDLTLPEFTVSPADWGAMTSALQQNPVELTDSKMRMKFAATNSALQLRSLPLPNACWWPCRRPTFGNFRIHRQPRNSLRPGRHPWPQH